MKGFDNIKHFINKLIDNNHAEWHDQWGVYSVQIGDNLLQHYLGKDGCRFFVSDFLDLNYNEPYAFSQIVSIGGFQVHNQGKKEAQTLNYDLTTIPIPLSNDSFGTNRYSITDNEQSPSIRSDYPRRTIIDLQELRKFGIRHSYNGVGEFIGLYYSVIDYAQKDGITPDEECLSYIIENIEHLVYLFNDGNERETLRYIAIVLVIKILIMRINEDHRIGCGIDHSIARILEREHIFPHGKAVYMGCLIVSVLLPEWEKWGLSFPLLMDLGHSFGFLGKEDIEILHQTNIEDLVQEAILIRQERKTMLQRLSKEQIRTAQINLTQNLKWGI